MALPPDPRGLSLWFPGGQHAAAQEKATRYFSPPSHKSGDALGSCLHVALSSSPAKRRHYITARRGRTTTKQILYLTWGTLHIDDRTLLHDVLSAYLLGMLIVSSFTFFLKKFIHKSNDKYYTLKASSSIDFLTGLYNVRHFDKTLNDVMTNAKDHSRCVSLLFIDIDHFKKVNDTYGHLNGDIVLKTLGELLQKQSRSSDVITRYGGEEFTVILINCGITEAKNAAERIRIMVESQEFDTRSNDKIRITVSIGVACYPETTAAEEKLIEQADIALYNAKRTGRNQVCVAQKG